MINLWRSSLLLASLFFGSSLLAATYNLPASIGVNGTPFKDCSGAGPVYTCTKKIDIKVGNTVLLTSNVTLNITPEFKVGGNVDNNGFVFNIAVTGKIHIDGAGTVLMNNLTASGDIVIHKQANLTGDVVSTNGDILIEDGNATINGNIDAQNGDVDIEGGNNTINGSVTATGGAGNLNIDGTSIVSGTCNPNHPQCDGGPGGGGPGGGPGASCSTIQIAANGEEFRSISGSSDSNIIAAGKNGSLYHYDGSNWTKHGFTSNQELQDVEVVAPNLAYAVGKKGKVIQYDGAAWSTMLKPGNEDLEGVWAISSSEVWVVGKKDALYLWNGGSWQDMSGGGQANVDNNQDLKDAWGDANSFYAVEKDGDLYRYSRTAGPWAKFGACNAAYQIETEDIWGDGAGNIYIAGKDKGANPDAATVLVYNEGSDSCSTAFATTTQNKLEGIYGNGNNVYAVGKSGLVVDNTSGGWSESTVGATDYKDVWVSSTNTAYYAGKGGFLTTCSVVSGLDHFTISPASFNATTCLPNAVTITAEDAANNPIASYTDTISISTSTAHGNWSVNDADNVTSPNPDTNDDGAVDYSFVASDLGVIVLDLSNTHVETLTITVSGSGVSSTSANIGFSDNVFVISEDPIQVAGRPQAMNVALWTNNGANCFIDTNYDYNPITIDAGIDRAGILPLAVDPSIGGVAIPDGSTNPILLNFSVTPGQASFNLDSTDVGQYRLTLTDNTLTHGDTVIIGTGNQLTVRPFGIAVTNIIDTSSLTPNPGNATPGAPIFTTAGNDLSATVAGVLWSAADDTNNDGVLDTGLYANNTVAPSYAWDTGLAVSLLATSYTPSPGTPGTLNNGSVAALQFGGGSALVTDLRYTEVGSFTLQSFADDFLGEPTADIVGDDIVVGRFIPADFEVSIGNHGILAEACGAFTYIGQDFGYDTAPSFTVTAMNALGDATAQYRDAFVKLDDSSVIVVTTQDDSKNGTDALPLDVSYSAVAMIVAPQNNGIVNYTFGADTLRYGPSAPVAFSKYANSQVDPFASDINPEITEISDGEVTRTPPSGTLDFNPVSNNLRFGRLRMDNVHGSELNALLMPAFTEYWNGFSFQKNTSDTCTSILATDLDSVGNPPGLSVPTVVEFPASAGDINYRYPSPGAGNTGTVDTTTELDTASHLWLRYDWDVDGEFDNDPVARATFGIFEGNPVQIYIQQIYE